MGLSEQGDDGGGEDGSSLERGGFTMTNPDPLPEPDPLSWITSKVLEWDTEVALRFKHHHVES